MELRPQDKTIKKHKGNNYYSLKFGRGGMRFNNRCQ